MFQSVCIPVWPFYFSLLSFPVCILFLAWYAQLVKYIQWHTANITGNKSKINGGFSNLFPVTFKYFIGKSGVTHDWQIDLIGTVYNIFPICGWQLFYRFLFHLLQWNISIWHSFLVFLPIFFLFNFFDELIQMVQQSACVPVCCSHIPISILIYFLNFNHWILQWTSSQWLKKQKDQYCSIYPQLSQPTKAIEYFQWH